MHHPKRYGTVRNILIQVEFNQRHFTVIAVIFYIWDWEDKPLCPGLLTKPILKLGWAFLYTLGS